MKRFGGGIALLFAGALHAQRVTSSADVAGTGVWYGDSVRSSGGTFSPSARFEWPRATISASGSLSQLGSGTSLQANIAPSVFTPSAGAFSLELAGNLGGSTHRDGTHTGQGVGLLRGYLMQGGAGAWIGGGAGGSWDGNAWHDLKQGEAGAWISNETGTALITASPVVVDSIHYTDFQAAARYDGGRAELGLSVGTRAGQVGSVVGGSIRTWGTVSVTNWLTSAVALVTSAGSYPVDFTQGFPGGKFVTVGLRFGVRPHREAAAMAVSAAQTNISPPRETFEILSNPGTRDRTLRMYAPSARSVEVNGDFTKWQPQPMTRGADGWWTLHVTLAPGAYQMNVRVDGGDWSVPPGLVSIKDEFGGLVGILNVE